MDKELITMAGILLWLMMLSHMLTHDLSPSPRTLTIKFFVDVAVIALAVVLGVEFYSLTQQVPS